VGRVIATQRDHELARKVMHALAAALPDEFGDVEVRDLAVYDRATGVA
jgi:hypothetical protein